MHTARKGGRFRNFSRRAHSNCMCSSCKALILLELEYAGYLIYSDITVVVLDMALSNEDAGILH
jgi:hypothetical protein